MKIRRARKKDTSHCLYHKEEEEEKTEIKYKESVAN